MPKRISISFPVKAISTLSVSFDMENPTPEKIEAAIKEQQRKLTETFSAEMDEGEIPIAGGSLYVDLIDLEKPVVEIGS